MESSWLVAMLYLATTASTLRWLILAMACFSAVQLKVQEEFDNVAGRSDKDADLERHGTSPLRVIVASFNSIGCLSCFSIKSVRDKYRTACLGQHLWRALHTAEERRISFFGLGRICPGRHSVSNTLHTFAIVL
ncbi:cytochrome p450 306a1 [Moniliophthora roreri MCA 2997]|uniref:Cytochrome p450 306a1 n=1 Tax=Moniliophthora roreri (strain MCA 2997) TaxID=1381753 RepID=V2XM74_MONRO|nr:cytochrome p450 306a1 [Moniliophthora roreri MCA 2997]